MGEEIDGAMQHAPQPGRQGKEAGEKGADELVLPCALNTVIRPIILHTDDVEVAVGELLAVRHDPVHFPAHGDV